MKDHSYLNFDGLRLLVRKDMIKEWSYDKYLDRFCEDVFMLSNQGRVFRNNFLQKQGDH